MQPQFKLEQLKLDYKPIYIYIYVYIYIGSVSQGNVISTSMWPHPFSIPLKKEKQQKFVLFPEKIVEIQA